MGVYCYKSTSLHPPIITIQTTAIAKYLENILVDNIAEVLKHEIAHIFIGHDESKTQAEEVKLKIFKDDKKPIKRNKKT